MTKVIVAKLNALMAEVGSIPKSGTNSFFNYKYRSHEDIMNALNPALIKCGLALIPVSKKVTVLSPGHILIEAVLSLTDGAESIEFCGVGEGIDISKAGVVGDKAAYKAQTGAVKYALNDMLALATDADPEADTQTDQRQNQIRPVAPPVNAEVKPKLIVAEEVKVAKADTRPPKAEEIPFGEPEPTPTFVRTEPQPEMKHKAAVDSALAALKAELDGIKDGRTANSRYCAFCKNHLKEPKLLQGALEVLEAWKARKGVE